MNEQEMIWQLLETVPDPEIPVLSVLDLGIVRSINVIVPQETVKISITPTYSGCPAMDVIGSQIKWAMLQKGYRNVSIEMQLSPPWTTEWITDNGKQKMKAFGIAPPLKRADNDGLELFANAPNVPCPLCNSINTSRISEFGSTACKSIYRCNDCNEPFDHFKCH